MTTGDDGQKNLFRPSLSSRRIALPRTGDVQPPIGIPAAAAGVGDRSGASIESRLARLAPARHVRACRRRLTASTWCRLLIKAVDSLTAQTQGLQIVERIIPTGGR